MPNTYVIYGHGSFDSQSLTARVKVPPHCTVHFAVGHVREINGDRMVGVANMILNQCQRVHDSVTTTSWWDDAEIQGYIYEKFTHADQPIPDYILGDMAGLPHPADGRAPDGYASPRAMVLYNTTGNPMRLSQILGSPTWKGRNPMTHFVWTGCRGMDMPRIARPDTPEYARRRMETVLQM